MRWAPALAARWLSLDDRELGRLGERLVAGRLRAEGWRVLGQRVRTARGELDLVAVRGGVLLCVEVKSGRARGPRARWRPADRFDARAARRLARAARHLAFGAGHRGAVRAELFEVLVEPGRPPRIERRAPRP